MLLVAPAGTRSTFSDQFLARLPLTEDHAEWRITLELIEVLVRDGNEKVIQILPTLTGHALNSVNNLNIELQTDKRTLKKIGQFVQNSGLFDELKAKTSDKVWNKLNKAAA